MDSEPLPVSRTGLDRAEAPVFPSCESSFHRRVQHSWFCGKSRLLIVLAVPVATHAAASRENGSALRSRSDAETKFSLRRRAAPRAADVRYRLGRPHATAASTVSGNATTESVLVQRSGNTVTRRWGWVDRGSWLPGESAESRHSRADIPATRRHPMQAAH